MVDPRFARTQQCEGCPWIRDGKAGHVDGFARLHASVMSPGDPLNEKVMACHESPEGDSQQACVGFLHRMETWPVRVAVMRGDFDPAALRLRGEQCESWEEMAAQQGEVIDG